jgi:hypothetical protein
MASVRLAHIEDILKMRHSDPGLRQPMEPIPTFRQLPGPVYFRQGAMEPTDWGTHSHPWGQFNFVAQG